MGRRPGGAERGKGAPRAVGERTRRREGKARPWGEKRRCVGSGLVGKEKDKGRNSQSTECVGVPASLQSTLLWAEWGPGLAPPVLSSGGCQR